MGVFERTYDERWSVVMPCIDLVNGKPDEALLVPLHSTIATATQHALSRVPDWPGSSTPLQYGDITFEPDDATGHFRSQLGALLTRRYGYLVDPALLFPTAGVSQAV